MAKGWWYRLMSSTGTVVSTAIAVLIANHPIPQTIVTNHVPITNRLSEIVLSGSDLFFYYWTL